MTIISEMTRCAKTHFAALVLLGACTAAQAKPVEGLPLRPGTRWVYRGTVTSGEKRELTYTVEVRDGASRGDAFVAHVLGDLSGDLPFWDGTRKPSERVVTLRRGHYFSRAAAEADEAGELFLEWPLAVGEQICPAPDEPMLCWRVEASGKVSLAGVKGAPPGEQVSYTLTQRDNTGVQTLELVPGVGFTAYTYHHRGSMNDVDVRLVEFVHR